MNGKSRRSAQKCFLRGGPKIAQPLPPPPPTPPDLFSITFPSDLKAKVSSDTILTNLLQFFESYPTVNPKTAENFSFNANTPGAVVNLYNSDFVNGTVRIKTPGIYTLKENIVFSPNPSNDFLPTTEQTSSLYPVGIDGPYHLGFFAAIAVEANDVIINLNGFSINQSLIHNLQQRFYAHIELANSPFVPNQGPHAFIPLGGYFAASRVLVTGGTLGVSSHHGIHANVSDNVVLYNIIMNEFEVAGVALNGTTNGILSKLTLNGITNNIRVLSSYPQALFLRRKMESLDPVPDISLNLAGGEISFATAIANINSDLTAARASVESNQTPTNFMGNQTGKYDGNMYGIVLNVKGVVVNDFLASRPADASGNINIVLYDNIIRNITSHPVEIIALDSSGAGVYNPRQIGPFGDVLDMNEVINVSGDDYLYDGTSLSNGQILLGKYKIVSETSQGSTNIEQSTINWAEAAVGASYANLKNVMAESGRKLVANGDSMAHVMKGNLGVFISGGIDITVDKIDISGVVVLGNDVASSTLKNVSGEDDVSLNPQYTQGGDAIGIGVTASTRVTVTNDTFTNINTNNNKADDDNKKQIGSGNSEISGI